MSNSNNTNKARLHRQLAKQERTAANSGDRIKSHQIHQQLVADPCNAERFGNHRNMYATAKVTERRVERKRLNRAPLDE